MTKLAKLGNPKDNLGIKKVSISKLPAAGIIHGSHAMMYGASKYGPYNWRDNAVVASIYYDAILRHIMAWYDQKEEVAEDSQVHHLGHILANCAILLDAMETGNLLDDRPHSGQAAKILERLNAVVKRQIAGQAVDHVETVPDATGDSNELDRPPIDGSRAACIVKNVENGHHQQPGHPDLPAKSHGLVRPPAKSPAEGSWSR